MQITKILNDINTEYKNDNTHNAKSLINLITNRAKWWKCEDYNEGKMP